MTTDKLDITTDTDMLVQGTGINSTPRLGIIGLGKLGQLRLVRAQKSGRFQVCGFFDVSDPKPSVRIPSYGNLEDLFCDGQPEAVIVATPAVYTNEYVQQALRRGIAVLAEKPPAVTVSSLEATERLMTGLDAPILMYGFNHHHKPAFKRIEELIASEHLGRLLWMRGRYGKEVDSSFKNNWRSDFRLSGGGILLDQGIHMVDLMRRIGGSFDHIQSSVTSDFLGIPGIEDNVFAILKSRETGITASLHSTMTQWRYLFSLEIFFEHGSILWNGLKTPSGNYGSDSLTVHFRDGHDLHEDFAESEIDEWQVELDIFHDSMTRGYVPESVSISSAKETLDLVENIYKADSEFWRERLVALGINADG